MMKSIKWKGEPISRPGMYEGIDIDLYHAAHICDGPSISSGGLRKIANESPAHFFAEWRGNPKRIDKPPSRALTIGRAAHHLHLGQEDFSAHFAIQPSEYEAKDGEMKAWNNNAQACKDWHKARRDEERSVLTESEAEKVIGMAAALGQHPIVQHGALNGLVERSMFWKDEKTGIWLKSRPDAIPGSSGDFVDFKSTMSVQWPDLMRAIYDYGYHQQGALVMEAARTVLKIKDPSFTLVFQEKEQPYCVRVVVLKEDDLTRGARQNRLAIDTFAKCLKENHWPGPGGDREDAEYIQMPEWAQKSIDDRLIVQGER